MMFGKLGPMELILILAIALVIFGPSKLPDIGKAFGKAIRQFKDHANEIQDSASINEEESKKDSE